ncbi:MAG: NADH-quinone oxidoreductase subunit M [Armatimonadetes bacterium]|nr:NADH-quinone oxidoreductase subunit M [Armatimonadota bacterium]
MNLFSVGLMTFLPLVGALVICGIPSRDERSIKGVAMVTTVLTLILSIGVAVRFGQLPSDQQRLDYVPASVVSPGDTPKAMVERGLHPFQPALGERRAWIPQAGIHYEVGVDGLSLPLILLSTILMVLVVIYSGPVVKDRIKWYYAFFLLLETAMLGVFVSLDLFLFYLFFEVGLVPMYFLIGIWGGPRREYAAIKFFLYTLVGSLAMLLALLAVYFYSGGDGRVGTFSLLELMYLQPSARMAGSLPSLCFWGIFLGFAIKTPMFPFHTWLPDAHVEAPTAGSVILAGVLLKLGTYGFLRVLMPLLPDQCQIFGVYVVALAAIAIVYGALVAMAQTDMKKLVAYSSVNHMGYVMLGLGAAMMYLNAVPGNPALARASAMAVNGAVLQMICHGIITSGLFFMVGIIYEQTHTRMIGDYGGLMKVMPRYSGVFIVMAMASLGLPALAGFVAEFHVFIGCLNTGLSAAAAGLEGARTLILLTAFSLLGVVLTAAYFLWLMQRILLGEVKEGMLEKAHGHLRDFSASEYATMVPLVIATVLIGIIPGQIVLNLIDRFDTGLLMQLGRMLGG